MLIQFCFKNFKSFRDETILDLSATKISEYSNHVASVGYEKLLPVAAIFGANAHGKSNAIEAIEFMHDYVIHSFAYGGESEDNSNKSNTQLLKPEPFLFDEKSRAEGSLFEVYFIDPESGGARTFNYGFTVDQKGINEEWLNYKTKSSRNNYKRIFYRNETQNELDLSGLPKNTKENLKVSLQKETLIVSLGAKLRIKILSHIRDWFLNNEFADFGRPLANFFLSTMLPRNFVADKQIRDKVISYLHAFDESIIDFDIKKAKDEDGDEAYIINAVHKMAGSDKRTYIPLQNESSGTLKMFALYQMLQDVLRLGGILFIDELNARLHPLLVRSFLLTFLDPQINRNNAQIIFTTHDVWQLNGNGLRRDEIWFTEKDPEGVCKLYSLADFSNGEGTKIRKDENYEKNYLLGKYGAIPSLKFFGMFKEE